MSQLELALKKARAASEGGRSPHVLVTPPIANAVFVSPWDFDEHVEESGPDRPQSGTNRTGVTSAAPPPAAARRARLVTRPAQFERFHATVRQKLAAGDEAEPHVREQFRKVAAALYHAREGRPIKIVMVASAVPAEGKTLTAVNLALTLAESYKTRVLLVDADLRRPSVHSVFDLPNATGLKEQLGADGEMAAIRISPHLAVLTAGTASVDPMGVLTSDRMRQVLAHASQECDWIILDTPPVELLPDAKLVGALADVAILVVHAASTSYELSKRAIESIGRDRFLGVVLNQLQEAEQRTTYDYSKYYHSR